MKKLAISALTTAMICCCSSGMEIPGYGETKLNASTYTKLYPKEFWAQPEMVSRCMNEIKGDVSKGLRGRMRPDGKPLLYNTLFRRYTWHWICEQFKFDVKRDKRKFLSSIVAQFPNEKLPFLEIAGRVGLEEYYGEREMYYLEREEIK
jgi:hypothetical protein